MLKKILVGALGAVAMQSSFAHALTIYSNQGGKMGAMDEVSGEESIRRLGNPAGSWQLVEYTAPGGISKRGYILVGAAAGSLAAVPERAPVSPLVEKFGGNQHLFFIGGGLQSNPFLAPATFGVRAILGWTPPGFFSLALSGAGLDTSYWYLGSPALSVTGKLVSLDVMLEPALIVKYGPFVGRLGPLLGWVHYQLSVQSGVGTGGYQPVGDADRGYVGGQLSFDWRFLSWLSAGISARLGQVIGPKEWYNFTRFDGAINVLFWL